MSLFIEDAYIKVGEVGGWEKMALGVLSKSACSYFLIAEFDRLTLP